VAMLADDDQGVGDRPVGGLRVRPAAVPSQRN
jgi:hypothetical protein